jgi:peptidoglycan/LPS O-acetylase OafA/YrhL
MENTNKARIEYIDFAKGFAILAIVVFHYCQSYTSGIFSQAILAAGAGVHLFFILSGFGLGLSSQVRSPLQFYKKRFLKILIPYYLVVLAIFAINLVVPIYTDEGLYALGGHLFLYKMFDERIMTSFGYHFWFVSTIVQFYIFFPVISYAKQRIGTGKIFLILSFSLSLFYWFFVSLNGLHDQRIFANFFLQYLWEFSLGIALANLYLTQGIKFWEQKKTVWLIVSLLSFSIMATLSLKGGSIGKTVNDLFASLGFLALSAFAYALCQRRLRPLNKIMVYIGKISYELYLVHGMAWYLGTKLLTNRSIQPGIAYSLLVILPSAIIVAHFLMSFLQRFYQNRLVRKLL